MQHIQTGELNNDFRTCLAHLMQHGMMVRPRGATTKELLNYNISLFNPRNRIINFKDRKTNLKYLLGELIWYFGGSNSPEGILPYSKFWDRIRNSGNMDGYEAGTINSNYGYRLFGHHTNSLVPRTNTESMSQWDSVINSLKVDKDTRQAIINIHLPKDRHEKNLDVPCTLTLQFFIRDNLLHMIVTMRSNDAVLGFTNDVFQFTMLQEAMLVQLLEHYPELQLGHYYHNAASMHVYDRHFSMCEAIIKDESTMELSMVKMDTFNYDVVKNLINVEEAWRTAGMSSTFVFGEVPAYKELSAYWQNLIKMCFSEDEDALHDVFGIAHS